MHGVPVLTKTAISCFQCSACAARSAAVRFTQLPGRRPGPVANPLHYRARRPAGRQHLVGTQVITSPPVTGALLAELAACSRQPGAWTAQLSRTGSLHAGATGTERERPPRYPPPVQSSVFIVTAIG